MQPTTAKQKLSDALGSLVAQHIAAGERGDAAECKRLALQIISTVDTAPFRYGPAIILPECTPTKLVFRVTIHGEEPSAHHIRVFPEFGGLRIVVTGHDGVAKKLLEEEFRDVLSRTL